MTINDDKEVVLKINELLDNYMKVENGAVIKIHQDNLDKILVYLLNNFVVLEEKITNDRTRTLVLYRRLNWLYNKILLIMVYDRFFSFKIQIQNLMEKMMTYGLSSFMYWFNRFVDFHLDTLKIAVGHDLSKEPLIINIPGCEMEGSLQFSSILIKTESQIDILIQFLFKTLSRAIDLYPAYTHTIDISLHDMVSTIFTKRNLECKTAILLFCASFYDNATSEDLIALATRIFQLISVIYDNLDEYIDVKLIEKEYFVTIFLKAFYKFLEMFHRQLKSPKTKIDQMSLEILIASIIQLMFNDSKLPKSTQIPSITHWCSEVIDDVLLKNDYSEAIVKYIDLIEYKASGDKEVLHVLKHKMVLEIEKAGSYDKKISSISSTWQQIQRDLALKTNFLLNNPQVPNNQFLEHLEWIKEAILLTFHVDFYVTRRHQIKHCLNYVCKYSDSIKPENVNSLYKFNSWHYDHIHLDFFDDLASITYKLTLTMAQRNEVTLALINVLIELYSLVLQIPSTEKIKEEKKLYLLATVLLPFIPSFEQFELTNKSADFTRIKSFVSAGMRNFLANPANCDQLNFLKNTSIKAITHFKFIKLGKPFEWLNFNIMQLIFKREPENIQKYFADGFVNLLMTNLETMSTYLLHYQNIRLKNASSDLDELKNVLCLHDNNAIILMTINRDYYVFCGRCKPKAPIQLNENDKEVRYRNYITSKNACIISSDFIDKRAGKIVIPSKITGSRELSFCAQFIKNIPACIRHSRNFAEFCLKDEFLDFIFAQDEKTLSATDDNLEEIIVSIHELNFDENLKIEIYSKMFKKLFDNTLIYNQKASFTKIQYHIVNMITTYGMLVGSYANNKSFISEKEIVCLKCMKLLIFFILSKDSEVKGVATNSMFRMLGHNNISLEPFIEWYKTNIFEHVIKLCLINCLDDPNPSAFFYAIVNFLKYLSFQVQKIHTFLKKNTNIILASIIVFCTKHKQMQFLNCIIDHLEWSIEEVFNYSCLNIYEKIYKLDKREQKECIDYIEQQMEISLMDIFKNPRQNKNILQNVLVNFNENHVFVMDVIKNLGDENFNMSDDETVANFIAIEFLGILNNFELILVSGTSEKSLKLKVLDSLGGLIRFLGGRRISHLCFKIMSLLRAIMTTNQLNLREKSLVVWKILINNCDISSLGPFLSQILVALECYIEDFRTEVEAICTYLIFENSNLLSTHISDLFFIEKTKYDNSIKVQVLNQIESQRLADDNDFEINLSLLIQHLKNEHADSNVKIYCLQYLEEFVKKDRKKFDNLIFGGNGIDPAVKYLLHVLANCSKSLHNKKLQIQTAKCFGELGALKPSMNKHTLLNKKLEAAELSVHSDEFASKILRIYCMYYKDVKDANHMRWMALAIQAVMKERKVNKNHKIWKALPEFTQELFKPLLTSSYVSNKITKSNSEIIFWNQAQCTTQWAYLLAARLIECIEVEETQRHLFNLLPSMKENQEICTILLPRIIVHYLQLNKTKELDENIYTEFQTVFKMLLDNTIYSEASMDELNYKFVASYDFTPVERKKYESIPNNIMSVSFKTAKMIFDILDFLRECKRMSISPELMQRINCLLERFSKRKLAEVNFKCGEYERAMIYFEEYFKSLDKNEQEEELTFLVNIYAKLRDPDLIEGVKVLRVTEWSLPHKVVISEITGDLEGTFSYIEMMQKDMSFTKEQIQAVINCYTQSNQNSTAILIGDQLLEKLYQSNKKIPYCDELKAEALWRLSKFDDLDELLSGERLSDVNNWNVICSKLLCKFRSEDVTTFWTEIEQARFSVMSNFKICDSEEAIYADNYNEIFHLHVLTEFEKFQSCYQLIKNSKASANTLRIVRDLVRELDSRMKLLQTTTTIIELSMALRRVLLLQLKKKISSISMDHVQVTKYIEDQVGKTWIECAKLATSQKMFAQAHAYLMEAEVYKPQELFIEKAKYLWVKDNKMAALRLLELNCGHLEKELKTSKKSADGFIEKHLLLSRARLDIARYNAEVKNVDFVTNQRLFKNALLNDTIDPKCSLNEETYLLLAEYMDRHHFSNTEVTSTSQSPAFEKHLEVMEAYGNSMKYGMTYVLQSMPRFLQIWFDVIKALHLKPSNMKTRSDEEIEMRINNYVRNIAKILKPYYFYTAFSQLVSRLCHASKGLFLVLKIIIMKLIEEYPQESMWFIMPSASSKDELRKKRANDILNSFSKEKQKFNRFNMVMDKIMALGLREFIDESFMATYCSTMEKLFKSINILMPLQKHLVVQPNSEHSNQYSQVVIHRLSEKVDIMKSMQKPKKITFIGSDGKEYPMLLKIKDDLRIDFRFMEFVKVINDFFNKDSEASKRCLQARTYSVIPWNEDMGLIEWVPNLCTLKSVIYDQYKTSNIKIPVVGELRRMFEVWQRTDDKIKFFNDMKHKYPPVLGKWYLEHFSNVQNYFSARQNYVRSVAIMSMIGYMMGLGDRHMENLMLDIHSGEVVHVDFNCIFNKGESLGYPETVPFRLTQAMIDAMGPLGIEGPFRKSCEVVLSLMQREKNTLTSYLRPFIYDPMIRKRNALDQAESADAEAIANLECVEKKLKGIVKKFKGSSGIPLSSEGQVKFIIDEATSDENLSVMYFHWSPYI